jgi:hypothetical protein
MDLVITHNWTEGAAAVQRRTAMMSSYGCASAADGRAEHSKEKPPDELDGLSKLRIAE